MFKRFKKIDRILILISLTGLIIMSYLIRHDSLFDSAHDTKNLEHIGELSTQSTEVRKKTKLSFIWTDIKNKSEMYQGDSIFTGSNSTAELSLTDGTTLIVSPNSLIVLRIADNNVNLDLKFGDLQGDIQSGSKVTLQSGDQRIEVMAKPGSAEKGRIKIERKIEGTSHIQSLKGKIQITNPIPVRLSSAVESVDNMEPPKTMPAPLVLNENESLKIDSAPIPEKSEVFVFDPSSTMNKELWLAAKTPVTLEWMGQGKADSFLFEASDELAFSKFLYTKVVKSKSILLENYPLNKSIFWRVTALDVKARPLATRDTASLIVHLLLAPQLDLPKPQQIFTFSRDKATDKFPQTPQVNIHWTDSTVQTSSYRLQIDHNADFLHPILDTNPTSTDYNFDKIESGSYFIRVQSLGTIRPTSPWSNTVNISVTIESEDRLPKAPVLTKKQIIFDVEKHLGEQPLLKWSEQPDIKKYQVSLQNTKTKEFLIKDQVVDSNQLSWKSFESGEFSYSVSGISSKGKLGPASQGALTVSLSAVKLSQIESIDIESNGPKDPIQPKSIPLNWSKSPLASEYEVELSQNSDFKNASALKFKSNTGRLTIKNKGQYFVRVKPLDQKGRMIASLSNVQDFKYQVRIPLTAPALAEPWDDTTIYLQVSEVPYIDLRWEAVEQAESYVIELSNDKLFSKPILKESTTKNHFTIKSNIPYGQSFWRVKALNPKKQSHWSHVNSFYLYSGSANEGKGEE